MKHSSPEEVVVIFLLLDFQEFVQAVDQLLKVRQAATDLKARIVELNDDRQASGKQLLQQVG